MKNIVWGKKYTTRDGTEKTQWVKIGVLGVSQKGREWGKLEQIPVGWDGTFQVFEQEERKPRQEEPSFDDDSSVPF